MSQKRVLIKIKSISVFGIIRLFNSKIAESMKTLKWEFKELDFSA